ncbi:uncharacterized protein MKK02DRAFT_23915 [Dioszegia hungarica]|uniref:Phytanoyl-CoA dioxygenase n=1 Tax=Dioszegia hungarica TaxID=4972 RepID=A0AA38HEC8_9TREE|nr:uncharacterized protein MKK02DRAFT_23915 [Dioszegia hungarica]KAI9637511.1 hypothetical protein MKK02DRAFT_23915 [Dioszegia hungarica]
MRPGTLKLRGDTRRPEAGVFPDLDSKGYTVVKGAIPAERAAEYVQRMYGWLESFNLGFKGNDPSTWHIDRVPYFNRGGIYTRNGAGHEQFAWDIRGEPGVINAFAKIWGTDELLVSFGESCYGTMLIADAVNISLPYPKEEMEGQRGKPWPHVDQSPNKRFKNCIQGIANLEKNGPDDGGLMVLSGSLPLFEEYFKAKEASGDAPEWSWRDAAWYSDDDLQWFYDRGCKWVKVEADPGDLILWDSRTIHYGANAQGSRPRVAAYVCYKPAADIHPDMKAAKLHAMEHHISTSHDPLLFRMTGSQIEKKIAEDERPGPIVKPVLTQRMKRLAGLVDY